MAYCIKQKSKSNLVRNSALLFDKIALACSEDRATLESDPSAVAGGEPMRAAAKTAVPLFINPIGTPPKRKTHLKEKPRGAHPNRYREASDYFS